MVHGSAFLGNRKAHRGEEALGPAPPPGRRPAGPRCRPGWRWDGPGGRASRSSGGSRDPGCARATANAAVAEPIDYPARAARSMPRWSEHRHRVARQHLVAVGGRLVGGRGDPVGAGVVRDHPVPAALERPRAVHHVAARRGEAVQQQDRRALAGRLPAERSRPRGRGRTPPRRPGGSRGQAAMPSGAARTPGSRARPRPRPGGRPPARATARAPPRAACGSRGTGWWSCGRG